jgi:hypothetical protein
MLSTNLFPPYVTAISLALAGVFACAHSSAQMPQERGAQSTVQSKVLPHVAAGCLEVCKEATYVEVSPRGDLCRCWAPDAFQYTFEFPDTSEKLSYSRGRWNNGIKNVHQCQAQGLAWEPSVDRDRIVCLGPSEQRTAN